MMLLAYLLLVQATDKADSFLYHLNLYKNCNVTFIMLAEE